MSDPKDVLEIVRDNALRIMRENALERWHKVIAQRTEVLEAFVAKYGKDPAKICQVEQWSNDRLTVTWWVTDRTPTSIEAERDDLRSIVVEVSKIGVHAEVDGVACICAQCALVRKSRMVLSLYPKQS